MIAMRLKQINIRIYAAFASLVLSLLAYANRDPINYDGILYLSVAHAYIQNGFHAAMALYPWPFYSILIAWLSQGSHLSLLHTAEAINAILFIILTISFISLVKELGGTRTTQIFAAIVILIHPQLNDYRNFIVRDFGYWALCLTGLWQLIRFIKTNQWRYSAGWFLALVGAALFRIEAPIILMCAPLALLFCRQPWRQYLFNLLKIYALPLLILIVCACVCFSHPTLTASHLGRLANLINESEQISTILLNTSLSKINIISNTVLNPLSAGDATLWFIFGFSGIFLWEIISTLNLLYAALAVHAMFKKLLPAELNSKIILIGFALITLLIPLCFYAQNYFLSDRYLILLALTLLIWAPFSLAKIFEHWVTYHTSENTSSVMPAKADIQIAMRVKTSWIPASAGMTKKGFNRWLFPLIVCLMFATSIGNIIHFGYSKAYITQAGLWLKQNTPATASVFSNNRQVLFYAERTPINWDPTWQKNYDDAHPWQTITDHNWQHADYLALRIKHDARVDEPKIIHALAQQPIKTFANKRGDEVLIFKLRE